VTIRFFEFHVPALAGIVPSRAYRDRVRGACYLAPLAFLVDPQVKKSHVQGIALAIVFFHPDQDLLGATGINGHHGREDLDPDSAASG